MESGISGSDRVIQSVQRAFGLVERLAAAPEGLRLSELADEAGLNRSTTHNLLASLDAIGWVEQPAKGGPYRLTGKMGQLMWRRIETEEILRAQARAILETLSTQTGETAYLAFASGTQYLCADAVESSEPLHLTVKIGEREPLLGTAIGHALLAEDDALAGRIAAADSDGWAQRSQDVTHVREQGFALDEDAYHPGVSCVAIAIGSGAALGVAGPSSRLSRDRLTDIAREMHYQARNLAPRTNAR